MGGVAKAVGKVVSSVTGGLLGGGQTKTPDVVTRDPEAEERAAQQKADEAANNELAKTNKRRRTQSLLSSAGERGTANNGKNTLGS